jgi:flagellar P-ring protein precursor FlgI
MLTHFIAAMLAVPAANTGSPRLKELVSLEGVRDNQLVGYGLVVGLAGTGDRRQTVFSAQTLANVLERMGVSVSGAAIRVNNVASVMLTATLPPFAQPGTRLDVTAAAIGDASNLQGGLLLMTSLRAADGQVYAVAQGPLTTGGFAAGAGGNSKVMNHPTVARIPNGAIVERGAPSMLSASNVRLQLRHADFTTAARIAAVVNKKFVGTGQNPIAKPENSALISVALPDSYQSRPAEFIAELEGLTVEADRTGRIVVNERTGTIVMGKDVRISPVAVMHGALTVEIQTTYDVSQPAPLSSGETQVTPKVSVGVKEETARNLVLRQGATVEELVRALNAIGSTPRDIIAIFQSLRAAGALDAELEII